MLSLTFLLPVYTEIPRLDMKYRTRIRSRVLNLQDAKNPQLCANFVSGEISPEKLATMTADVSHLANLFHLAIDCSVVMAAMSAGD